MSRSTAAIIATLKSPVAPRGGISRPFGTLLDTLLASLSIHLAVEDIEEGLLLFWDRQQDFDQTVRALTTPEVGLRDASWDKGEMLWRLTLLQPGDYTQVQGILGACRGIILSLFGTRSMPEVTGSALAFRAPADLNLLKAFWRKFQVRAPDRG